MRDTTSKSVIDEAPKMNWVANYHKAKDYMFASLGRILLWSSVFAVTDILLKPSIVAFVCIGAGTIALTLMLDVLVTRLLNYLNFRRYLKWFDKTSMHGGMDECCREIEKRADDADRRLKTPRCLAFSRGRSDENHPLARTNSCLDAFCWNGLLWSSARRRG